MNTYMSIHDATKVRIRRETLNNGTHTIKIEVRDEAKIRPEWSEITIFGIDTATIVIDYDVKES